MLALRLVNALEYTVKITEATVKEYGAGTVPTGANAELEAYVQAIADTQQKTSLQTMRSSNADAQIQLSAKALKENESMQGGSWYQGRRHG